ncbi:hypothetical protein GCM10011317_29210 [Niveispirillum cyanobacteriorum]|nr:hypothetical protein GCM10011317_29210 [Niveispirillum cyanobacteriorum]
MAVELSRVTNAVAIGRVDEAGHWGVWPANGAGHKAITGNEKLRRRRDRSRLVLIRPE